MLGLRKSDRILRQMLRVCPEAPEIEFGRPPRQNQLIGLHAKKIRRSGQRLDHYYCDDYVTSCECMQSPLGCQLIDSVALYFKGRVLARSPLNGSRLKRVVRSGLRRGLNGKLLMDAQQSQINIEIY